MKTMMILGLMVAGTASAHLPQQTKPADPAMLKAEIEALRAPQVAWRGIAWKSCLLDGLKESREKNKPLILWVFIDRPIDDARC